MPNASFFRPKGFAIGRAMSFAGDRPGAQPLTRPNGQNRRLMAKKKQPKINGALSMQQELEELFFQAKKAKNIKQAGYIAQVWASLESHASLERDQDKEDKTALDDLVDILKNMRSKLYNDGKGEKEDDRKED
jgi:hypothetical protein